MLQERLDDDINRLAETISGLSMQLHDVAGELQALRMSQKQGLMRACLKYYMDMYPNEMSSPLHYLRILRNDLLDYFASKGIELPSTQLKAADAASQMCRPFLAARRNKTLLSQTEAFAAAPVTTQRHHKELESSLLAVADLCLHCSDDLLMEFMCEAVDMPDLVDDDDI